MPQIITAAATLGGVVLTLIFTSRRESKRTDQMLTFERDKILADDRRTLFVRTAHELQRMRELLQEWAILTQEGNDEAWSDEVTRSADALFRLETELRLLAPTLVDDVRAATNLARSLRDLDIEPESGDRDDLLSQYIERTRTAMKLMRELLGT